MKKIDIASAPRYEGSDYPPPYDLPCRERVRHALGDAAGLTQFGVNLQRLRPGCWSSQRHWHTAGLLASMSRKGMPYDNAMMESFFASLKQELTHHERFADRDEARSKVFEYIEVFYNRQRLHSGLDYRSPDQFEKLAVA